MYVIDTNAFYYATQTSECTYSVEKLQEFIRTHETIISTTSLFEFLIRHRDKLEIVQKGGKFLYDNNIKIQSFDSIISSIWILLTIELFFIENNNA